MTKLTKSDIFIADAHIKSADTPLAEEFVAFLDQIKGSTRTLYILGDLFDFWFGENKASFTLYQPILDKLKELSDASVKIVYFEGNHDFFMGSFFTRTLNADVYADDADIDIDQKRFHITHGDKINSEDESYLRWRRFIRSAPMYWLMRALPARRLLWLANKLSHASRKTISSKMRFNQKAVDDFVAARHNEGAYCVVFAHTHAPVIDDSGDNVSVNPGAFCDNGSYAEYKDGRFCLRNFTRTVAR